MSITQPRGTLIHQIDVTEERDEGRLRFDESLDRVVVILDRKGEYRWRRISGGNYEAIATSGEGYDDPQFAERMALRCNAVPFLYTSVARPSRVWVVEAQEDQS